MNKEIRFAVLGCGRIGKRHIEMINATKGALLVATCDLKTKVDLGIVNDVMHYDSTKSLFSQVDNIDVVAIATPNGLHAIHALEAINSGAHPIIEKPMALKVKDAEMVLHQALQNGKYVFGVMQNRYSPPSRWLNEIVSSKKWVQSLWFTSIVFGTEMIVTTKKVTGMEPKSWMEVLYSLNFPILLTFYIGYLEI